MVKRKFVKGEIIFSKTLISRSRSKKIGILDKFEVLNQIPLKFFFFNSEKRERYRKKIGIILTEIAPVVMKIRILV